MDKKRQMVFNLNNFLLAFSEAMNSKKSAYIALNLALKFGFDSEKLADICSYSLIFNLPKEGVKDFEFLEKSHLEDSLFQEITRFSNDICKRFDFSKNSIKQRVDCIEFVKNSEKLYDKNIVKNFLELSKSFTFFLDLENENEIIMFIYSNLSDFTKAIDFEDILKMTTIFHKFQNNRSKIIENASKVADFFEFEHKDKQIFLIAASLQNIGKLYIEKDIVDKKEPLTYEQSEILKSYPYHTKRVLNSIMGFADICSIAYKVEERLDGSGAFGLSAKDLSFKDRLLSTLVIYCDLQEENSHKESIEIMLKMIEDKKIDESIVDIFDKILQ